MIHKVKDHDNLIKVGGSVVSTDTSTYESYIARRNFLAASRNQTVIQENKINSLEAELQEMKELIKQVLNGKANN